MRRVERVKYKARIQALLTPPKDAPGGAELSIEHQSHWAKYLCILVSGYLEVAIREIFVEYSANKSAPVVADYVENSWPKSKNMNCATICRVLGQFNIVWREGFEEWLEDDDTRKGKIDSLVKWRNGIAHGNEIQTTGVTLVSVKERFSLTCDLVKHFENEILK